MTKFEDMDLNKGHICHHADKDFVPLVVLVCGTAIVIDFKLYVVFQPVWMHRE